MNELKRQLNEKVGDTNTRTANVIQKIEAGKKVKRQTKKSNLSGPIYVAIVSFVTVLALFFLLGPWDGGKEQQAHDPSPTPPTVTEPGNTEEGPSQKELLRKYFKKDGDVAYFKGSGNEYASFTETTTWINDDYVQILVDNGGSITQNIYRITDADIRLVLTRNAEDEVVKPTLAELNSMETINTLLEAPFSDNWIFDDRTMFTNVPFKTPYEEFNTILVESKTEEIKISKYYAEGYGLVGEVYTFEDGTKIESYLTSINEQPTVDDSLTIEIYHETLKSTDKYFIKDLPFIDPYVFMTNPDYYAMTYLKLIQTNTKELGVLTYACNDKEQCSHVFVAKERGEFSIITHAWSSYGNVQLSPNQEFALIPIYSTEQDGASIVERNQILLFDLSTFKQIIPETYVEYFESPMYPIVSFKLTNTSVTLTVGDVASYHHAEIAAWQQQSAQKTKEITVPISQ